jgi:hypothetical protein
MSPTTAPGSLNTPPGSPTVSPLPTSKHLGPGFSLQRNTSVRQTPALSRNGGLPSDAAPPRVITRNPEAGSTNSRVIDRAALIQANDNNTEL